MKHQFFRFISSILPFSLFSTSADAYINFKQSTKSGNHSSSALSNCEKLVELELKEDLTSKEWDEGRLIHQLVQQISNEPLDYCVQLTSMDFLIDQEER